MKLSKKTKKWITAVTFIIVVGTIGLIFRNIFDSTMAMYSAGLATGFGLDRILND